MRNSTNLPARKQICWFKKKWLIDLNKHFSEEDKLFANRYIKQNLKFLNQRGYSSKNQKKIASQPVSQPIVIKIKHKCWWGHREKETLVHCWWECLACMKISMDVPQKVKTELLFNPQFHECVRPPKEFKSVCQSDSGTPMLSVALCILANQRKPPMWPSVEGTEQMCHMYTIE